MHEGPQRIGKACSTAELSPGMVVSNEPGYYKADCYGIRHENLLLVKELGQQPGADRAMYGFEALTLVPFDRALLDPALMTGEEIAWLNAYHRRVRETIAPLLDGSDRAWLENATSEF